MKRTRNLMTGTLNPLLFQIGLYTEKNLYVKGNFVAWDIKFV